MKKTFLTLLFALATGVLLHAEDGSRLWLRASRNPSPCKVATNDRSATARIAVQELSAYWHGAAVRLVRDKSAGSGEGFEISSAPDASGVTVKAGTSRGLLYGAYELLRIQDTGLPVGALHIKEQPTVRYRLLNHWDNLDGSIERGYAGKSIWKWDEIDGDKGTMSTALRKRLTDYCRANASIGINGSVINNVNASPKMLNATYIKKVKVLADLFRDYGIRVYLSVNFASPMAEGGLPTADPLDEGVRRWWRDKAGELYKAIPDFGGFLVKANSEGQPGPGDYHRTHAEGANMLADALQPYGGLVIWRSFVYGNHEGEDRVMQAVSEFKDLDGQFRDNVILQCKNGPLDFQPREPYAPLFDNIRQTPMMAELQITQEYLGQSRHLVYLAPMWKEFFSFVRPDSLVGIAGVANIGDDANWCGHHYSQANWYAFGRLAWNASLSSDSIATEWLKQTFTRDTAFVNPMREVMASSREACVDYMMPLGLHHIFKADHHYGPEPQGFYPQYPIEWCPVYYHKADSAGIGFDRTMSGSKAVSQYRHPYDSLYNDINTCPEEYLLWFHHVGWNHKMKDGSTLWQSLCSHYNHGVAEAQRFADTWKRMRPYVDPQRFDEVSRRLEEQVENAREWRDTCLGYFQTFSRQAILPGQ